MYDDVSTYVMSCLNPDSCATILHPREDKSMSSQAAGHLRASGSLVLQVVTLVADHHTEVEEVQLLPHSVDLPPVPTSMSTQDGRKIRHVLIKFTR